MTRLLTSPPLRFLQAAACIVVLAWAVTQAAHILSILLIALLLAFCVLPVPKLIMRRFKLGHGTTVAFTVTLVGLSGLLASLFLANSAYRMQEKLPFYQERLQGFYSVIGPFFSAHHIQSPSLLMAGLLRTDRLIEFAGMALPGVLSSVSDGVLISLLCVLFVIELSVEEGKQSSLVAALTYYGRDVQQFIAITAKTGAMTALANLVLLVVLGVDFPVLWCALYFFLQFIPNIGALIALVPPTLLALITLGWEKALLVAVGFLVTNMVAGMVLNPIFMKKGVNVSFLEIMLSLIVWGSLLGPSGSIVGIPLTLVLRKIIEKSSTKQTPVASPPV
jgi:AI-2 transport protein TqsA